MIKPTKSHYKGMENFFSEVFSEDEKNKINLTFEQADLIQKKFTEIYLEGYWFGALNGFEKCERQVKKSKSIQEALLFVKYTKKRL